MARRIQTLAKRRSKLTQIVVVTNLVIGLILLVAFLGSKPQKIAEQQTVFVAEYDAIEVPVPKDAVPAGTKLSDIAFTVASYPRHQLPQDAITDLNGYSNAVALYPLPPNLPLFAKSLSFETKAANPVAERIPPGMRAMSIKVDATTAVEGWIGPGSEVDVLLVSKDGTSVVAENVKILSVERSVAPLEGKATSSIPTTVTLLVTQEQCLAINTAIPLGRIAFALRGTSDTGSWGRASLRADSIGKLSGESGASRVGGFVEVSGDDRAFVFVDGKWVRTDVVPDGFLPAKEERALNTSKEKLAGEKSKP